MKVNYGLVAIAVAILVVGALWLGMPLSTLLVLGIVLVCPIMMMVMMKGMHADEGGRHDHPESNANDQTTRH
ncbi:DUF2933 domain-containing protein [Thermostaphylospora chromogena]|uniref:DUF2933 domain-containing protein n=1 Tax=Thermostaphylospora chromogena TaxID=35622 RepID=A0A1H1C283_9ACTN|nr:DUF2933 domain-containing protein [Thermostaphylospora chromogena]SDQ58347.1 Protein of unknown function [Thermostaphylospora chromogena]